MQLRCVELTEFTPPPPKSLVEPHTRVLCVRAIRCVFCEVAESLPIRTEIYLDSEVVEFYISDHPELSVCLCIRSACEWDGFAAATQTESDSARAELRESRDLAHDCQSRELRCCTTHAGVVTICTVPEMLPDSRR